MPELRMAFWVYILVQRMEEMHVPMALALVIISAVFVELMFFRGWDLEEVKP